jgi:hypothetical protein
MTIPKFAIAAALAILTLPGIASAQFLLDTGTPTQFTSPLSVSSASSYGVEFSLTAGESLQQIALYLTPGSQNYQNQYLTLNLYNVNLTTATNPSVLQSFQLQYTASGWNSTATSYVAPATGTYWLTVQTASSGYTLDAPEEATQPTGTVPAIEFAVKGTRTYTVNNSASFGIQIGTAPEPSSWALGLLAFGFLAFLGIRSRRA